MIKKYLKIVLFIVVLFMCNNSFCQKEDDGYGVHKVKQGETLYSISKTYFLSVKDVLDANKDIKDSIISIGQEIRIPKTVRNNSLFNNEKEDENNSTTVNEEAIFKPKKQNSVEKKINKKTHLNVALLLPLYYENLSELSFNQYNIAEKGNKHYKCFSYISFYEGARIALDKLEKQGYNVSLYVFDVGEEDKEKMNHALNYPVMKEMNLIIPLVFKNSFSLAADFAKKYNIPIINPMSPSENILDNNYVFKIQPSDVSEAETIMKYIESKVENPNVVVLYEDGTVSNTLINYYKERLSKVKYTWTILNYKKLPTKLAGRFMKDKKNIVINLIDRQKEREDMVYANGLLKKLAECKNYDITLFAQYSWTEFNNMDFALLERLNYHFTLSYLNDYTNPNFVSFVKTYRENFKTEPDKIYAGMGYDIITYFVPALIEKGEDFMSDPNIKNEKDMINRYHFIRQDANHGYQNKTTTVYKISNYKIKSEWNY
jgi:ABC-type branched-subunit amino acid transport system substrate-binding protein